MAGNESAAQNIGGILVEISADVSGLITASRRVEQELKNVGTAADSAGAHVDQLETQVTQTAAAVSRAAGQFGGLQQRLAGVGNQVTDFFLMVSGGQGVLRALSTQANQLGMIFGPQGAIIGGLVGLGAMFIGMLFPNLDQAKQKSKELEDALKSLGDVFQITAGGAVVLAEKFERLAEADMAAAKAQLATAIISANKVIADSITTVESAIDSQFTWKASLEAAGSQLERLRAKGGDWKATLDDLQEGHEGAIAGVSMLNKAVDNMAEEMGITRDQAKDLIETMADFNKDKSPEHAKALRDKLLALSASYHDNNNAVLELIASTSKSIQAIIQATDERDKSRRVLEGDTVATEENTKAKEANARALKSLIERTHEEAETAGMSARAKALYKAKADGANQAQIDGINADYDKIESAEKAKKAQQEHNREVKASEVAARHAASAQDAVAQKIENMRQRSELTAESQNELSRSQTVLNAQQSLGKAATKEQIALMGEYAGKVWDVTNAEKMRQQEKQKAAKAEQSQKAAKLEIATTAVATGGPGAATALIDAQEAAKIAVYEKYREEDKSHSQLYEDAITAIHNKANRDRVKATSDAHQKEIANYMEFSDGASQAFAGLADAMAASAGKGSAAYMAAFAIQKGFVVASATLSMYSAAMKALDDWSGATTAGRFALMGSVLAAGGGLLSAISGISMGGGRATGGPVLGGSAYRVGEGNKPEIFKAGNGNQYMIPGQNGRVIPNSDIGGGGVNQNITFNIQTTGGIDDATMAKMAVMMKQVSINTIKDQQRPNGLLQRSR